MKAATATFLILLASLTAIGAAPKDEIESLITYVGGLEGTTFIRNGGSHSAEEAEAHLRMKWERAGKRVKTAEDFIKGCATKSSFSGKPYKIRFKDGTERECGKLLTEKLKAIRAVK